MVLKTEQNLECVWIPFTTVWAPVANLFLYIIFFFLKWVSVSGKVGQDFLCNMLYNCVNKSETVKVVTLCIH